MCCSTHVGFLSVLKHRSHHPSAQSDILTDAVMLYFSDRLHGGFNIFRQTSGYELLVSNWASGQSFIYLCFTNHFGSPISRQYRNIVSHRKFPETKVITNRFPLTSLRDSGKLLSLRPHQSRLRILTMGRPYGQSSPSPCA